MTRCTRPVVIAVAAMMLANLAATPASAGSATLTRADRAALKQAIVGCKAEAKGKKIKWLERRKYVNGCVTEAMRDRPNINVIQMLREHPEMRDMPNENWDSI